MLGAAGSRSQSHAESRGGGLRLRVPARLPVEPPDDKVLDGDAGHHRRGCNDVKRAGASVICEPVRKVQPARAEKGHPLVHVPLEDDGVKDEVKTLPAGGLERRLVPVVAAVVDGGGAARGHVVEVVHSAGAHDVFHAVRFQQLHQHRAGAAAGGVHEHAGFGRVFQLLLGVAVELLVGRDARQRHAGGELRGHPRRQLDGDAEALGEEEERREAAVLGHAEAHVADLHGRDPCAPAAGQAVRARASGGKPQQ